MRWTDSEEDEPFASETEQRVAPLQLRCLQAETSPAELMLAVNQRTRVGCLLGEHMWPEKHWCLSHLRGESAKSLLMTCQSPCIIMRQDKGEERQQEWRK